MLRARESGRAKGGEIALIFCIATLDFSEGDPARFAPSVDRNFQFPSREIAEARRNYSGSL